jgi:hypothetical protein
MPRTRTRALEKYRTATQLLAGHIDIYFASFKGSGSLVTVPISPTHIKSTVDVKEIVMHLGLMGQFLEGAIPNRMSDDCFRSRDLMVGLSNRDSHRSNQLSEIVNIAWITPLSLEGIPPYHDSLTDDTGVMAALSYLSTVHTRSRGHRTLNVYIRPRLDLINLCEERSSSISTPTNVVNPLRFPSCGGLFGYPFPTDIPNVVIPASRRTFTDPLPIISARLDRTSDSPRSSLSNLLSGRQLSAMVHDNRNNLTDETVAPTLVRRGLPGISADTVNFVKNTYDIYHALRSAGMHLRYGECPPVADSEASSSDETPPISGNSPQYTAQTGTVVPDDTSTEQTLYVNTADHTIRWDRGGEGPWAAGSRFLEEIRRRMPVSGSFQIADDPVDQEEAEAGNTGPTVPITNSDLSEYESDFDDNPEDESR